MSCNREGFASDFKYIMNVGLHKLRNKFVMQYRISSSMYTLSPTDPLEISSLLKERKLLILYLNDAKLQNKNCFISLSEFSVRET
jgi:hypothetical protein